MELPNENPDNELDISDEVDTHQNDEGNSTVPLTALAKERAKKREAQASAEQAQLENERLKQELEAYKQSTTTTQVSNEPSLDIYDETSVERYIQDKISNGIGAFQEQLNQQRQQEQQALEDEQYLQSEVSKYDIYFHEDQDLQDIARATLSSALSGANSREDYAYIAKEVAERVSKKFVVKNQSETVAEQRRIDPPPTSAASNDGSRIADNAQKAGKRTFEDVRAGLKEKYNRESAANKLDLQR